MINNINEISNLLDASDEIAQKQSKGISDYVKLLLVEIAIVYSINTIFTSQLEVSNSIKVIINIIMFIIVAVYIVYSCKIEQEKMKKKECQEEAKRIYNQLSELIDKGDTESINQINRLSVKYTYSDIKVVIAEVGVINNKKRFKVFVDYDIYKNKILAYEQ